MDNEGGGGGNSALAALAAMQAHKASSSSDGGGGGGGDDAAASSLSRGIVTKVAFKALGIEAEDTNTGDHIIANVGNTQQGLSPEQVGLERFSTKGIIDLSDLAGRMTSEITPLTEGIEASQVSDAPVDTSGGAGGGGGDFGGGGGGGGSSGDYEPAPAAGGGGSSPMLVFQGHADTIEAPNIGGGGGILEAILGGGGRGGGGGGMEI